MATEPEVIAVLNVLIAQQQVLIADLQARVAAAETMIANCPAFSQSWLDTYAVLREDVRDLKSKVDTIHHMLFTRR